MAIPFPVTINYGRFRILIFWGAQFHWAAFWQLYLTPTCSKGHHFNVAGRSPTWCSTITSCHQLQRDSCQRWSSQALTSKLQMLLSSHCWLGKFPPHSNLFPRNAKILEALLSLFATGEIKAIKNMNASYINTVRTETASQTTATEWSTVTIGEISGHCMCLWVQKEKIKALQCAGERVCPGLGFIVGEEWGRKASTVRHALERGDFWTSKKCGAGRSGEQIEVETTLDAFWRSPEKAETLACFLGYLWASNFHFSPIILDKRKTRPKEKNISQKEP